MMKATIGADDGLLLGKNVLYYQVNYKFCWNEQSSNYE